MKPHQIDSMPSYWLGRMKMRALLADDVDPVGDVQKAMECLAIKDALEAKTPLGTIPEYKIARARVTTRAWER
jgi:hypothetical protein